MSIGGEGFAFVLQSNGLDAAGCAGTGVGYAQAPQQGCTRNINSSVTIQFDVHSNLRWEKRTVCRDSTPTGACSPGASKTTWALESDSEYAMSVYLGGLNGQRRAVMTYVLEPYERTRFDDGNVHDVRVEYLPPPGLSAQGRLNVFLDGSSHVALSLPIALNHTLPGSTAQGNNTAYVGFTASTGNTSERHDIISFSYCHLLGCAAV